MPNPATRLESETYRVNSMQSTHTSTAVPPTHREIANRAPAVVATPLPPRNRRKQVKVCPSTAAANTPRNSPICSVLNSVMEQPKCQVSRAGGA